MEQPGGDDPMLLDSTDIAKAAEVESESTNIQEGSRITDGTSRPSTEAGPAQEHERPNDVSRLGFEDETSSVGGRSSFSVALSVDTDSDADSALGLDMSRPSSSVSVSSSVYHFVEEFGRTFHKYKEGKYFLPNDEQEQSRLDLQHSIALRILGGKLFLAPTDKPHRVLDVGTGTGIWAIEFADKHPESEVLGTDLSPIQPEYVPSNCRFEIDDAEDEWVFSHKFDYIHGRYMCAFITDPRKMFAQIYENLNPGGWVEFQETIIHFKAIDQSLEGTALQRWNRLLLEGIRKIGRDALSGLKYRKYMADVGFQNVQEKKFAVPASPWAKGRDEKILGAMQMTNNLEGVQGITMGIFTKALGWSREAVELFLVDVRKDMTDKNIHSFITIMAVWGQKPGAASEMSSQDEVTS